MTDDQIKQMANRFLGWRLPENFCSDAGISFKKTFNEHTVYPAQHNPMGTNLFDAIQAEEMVRYIVEGLSQDDAERRGWNDAIEAAAASVHPMLRSMLSRSEAYKTILALKKEQP